MIIEMERNMNTSVNKIENTVRHFGNKMGIKLAKVNINLLMNMKFMGMKQMKPTMFIQFW